LTVLINSAWLLSFHGNVGQIPAIFIAFSLSVDQPLISIILLLVAISFEPKLAPSLFIVALINGWIYFFALFCFGVAAFLLLGLLKRDWYDWLIESNLVIPWRMAKTRGALNPFPWFTANALLFTLPWLGFAMVTMRNYWFWFPVLIFLVITWLGKVVRPNHLIPLVGWIVAAFVPNVIPGFVLILVVTELLSSGLYLGNVWGRFYPPLEEINLDARLSGEYLRNQDGIIWVNSFHSGVYVYAQSPPPFGLPEQVEIRDVVPERREKMREGWREMPPDWVVMGDSPGVNFRKHGYKQFQELGGFRIYKKI
jgi:hypothetical protein